LAATLVAAPAAAAFEQPLIRFHEEFLAVRAEQKKIKAEAASADIEPLARAVKSPHHDAKRLRDELSDLRERARARRRKSEDDPLLGNDLEQFASAINDYALQIEGLVGRARIILDSPDKDHRVVPAARRLESAASWLRFEADLLESDARQASRDFRRAGLKLEALDIEDASRQAESLAFDLERLAIEILEKVRP
jgi:hypothetical protein